LVGREAGGYDFKGVIHRRLNAVDEFAVSLSLDELRLLGA